MLTLGKVVDVLTTENKLRVRTPIFETSGDPTQVILTCAVCHDPGSINGYKVDDTVYVTFTDNEFNRPVVLGKLYLGIDNEETSNSLKADSLEVSNSAILPANTKIGQLSLLDLDNNIKKLTTIENVLNNKQNKLVAGSNITLTVNPLDDTVRISSTGGGGGGDAVWGEITGTLSDQADLNLALAGKASSTALTNETVTRAEEDGKLRTAIDTKQDKLTAGEGIDITNNVISCTLEFENTIPERLSTAYNLVTNLNQYTMPNVKFGTEQSGPGYIYRVFKNSNTDAAITDDTTIKNYLTIMTGNDAIPVYELTDGKAAFIYCTADNSFWKLQRNTNKQLWAIKVANRPFASTDDLNNGLNTKQNKLTAGTGIDITDDVISCTVTPQQPVWGNITGTLSNQTDLNTALNSKASTTALQAVAEDLEEEIDRATKAEADNLQTAESYTNSKVSAEETARSNEDTALSNRITTIEGKEAGWDSKQDKLTPGTNITISNNIISSKDTTYSAGTGIIISNNDINVDTTVIATVEDLSHKADQAALTNETLTRQAEDAALKQYVDDLVGEINAILATLVTPE